MQRDALTSKNTVGGISKKTHIASQVNPNNPVTYSRVKEESHNQRENKENFVPMWSFFSMKGPKLD